MKKSIFTTKLSKKLKKYSPFDSQIIDEIPKIDKNNSDKYFCDNVHKTLEGNSSN